MCVLLSCSSLDKKVDNLNYKEDIQKMEVNGKLTREEAQVLIGHIHYLHETMPTETGINKTYREVLKEAQSFVVPDDTHNAANSLSYAGTYEGTLFSADCANLNAIITLDYDGNYTKKTTCPKSSDPKKATVSEGKFTWDKAGNVITLTGENDGEKFMVVESAIIMLDQEGKAITGDAAEKYRLKQTSILE